MAVNKTSDRSKVKRQVTQIVASACVNAVNLFNNCTIKDEVQQDCHKQVKDEIGIGAETRMENRSAQIVLHRLNVSLHLNEKRWLEQ